MSQILSKNFGSLGFQQLNNFISLNSIIVFSLQATLYFFSMLGSMIASAFVKTYGLKKIFIIGGLMFSVEVIAQILPSWYNENTENDNFWIQKNTVYVILFLAQALSGFGSALIWVSQGEYMSLCADEQKKGFYFGYFWVWYMFAQVIGNLSGALLITHTFGPVFFIIMSSISVFFTFGFFFISVPDKRFDQNEESLLQNDSFKVRSLDTIKLLFSGQMNYLILMLVWNGGSIAYWSSILTPLICLQLPSDTDDVQLQQSLFAMVAFGFGEVIGGFCHGLLIDRMGSKNTVLLNIFIIILMIGFTLLSIMQLEYNFLTFLTCFMWGYQDGALNIFVFQILGFEFKSTSDPFGVFNLVQGLSVFTFQLIQGAIDSKNPEQLQHYTICVGIFAILANMVSYQFKYKQKVTYKEIL